MPTKQVVSRYQDNLPQNFPKTLIAAISQLLSYYKLIQIRLIAMQDQTKGGNSCLFFTLKILNLVFAICAVALVALAIWMWRSFGVFNMLEISFICLGVFEFLIVILAWSARKSITKLQCYNFFLFALFVAQLTATIVAFALKDRIIQDIKNKTGAQKQVEYLNLHYNVVAYYTLGTLVLMVILLVFTQCYIRSVKEKNFYYDYRVLDDDGRKISLQEKSEQDRRKIQSKYASKREEYAQKYSGYQKYKTEV